MARSRRRSRKKRFKRRVWIFFIAGIIIGGIGLFLYKARTPKVYVIPKRPVVAEKKAVVTPARPRIAIVLDDFGYNYKNVEAVMAIKRPVTFSILPNLPYSKSIARRVHQKGFEAILHLPLEPHKEERYIRPEINTINVDMKKEEVLAKLENAVKSTPFINGISGHQGSKATEDAALMKIIFSELKNRDLFFLDSLVSSKSVCKRVAKETGIRFARRDVFLDNKGDFEYIKGQMRQLIKKAKRSGSGIGIGHDREETVSALFKLIPDAETEGIEFVFLSELVK